MKTTGDIQSVAWVEQRLDAVLELLGPADDEIECDPSIELARALIVLAAATKILERVARRRAGAAASDLRVVQKIATVTATRFWERRPAQGQA